MSYERTNAFESALFSGKLARLPQAAKVVVLFLTKFETAQRTDCFPGIDLIAKTLGMSNRTVQDAMIQAEEWGVVTRFHRPGASGRSKAYKTTLPGDPEWETAKIAGSNETAESSVSTGKKLRFNRQRLPFQPAIIAGELPSVIPTVKPSVTPASPSAVAAKKRVKKNYGPDFEEWWALYPRQEAKGGAEASYQRARKFATREELLDGVKRFSAQMDLEARDRDKVCHPTTWLNQKRWLDVYSTPSAPFRSEEPPRSREQMLADAASSALSMLYQDFNLKSDRLEKAVHAFADYVGLGRWHFYWRVKVCSEYLSSTNGSTTEDGLLGRLREIMKTYGRGE